MGSGRRAVATTSSGSSRVGQDIDATDAASPYGFEVDDQRSGSAERSHGRILQVELTDEGQRRVEAATPKIRALEQSIEADFTAHEIAIVKRWLVESALRTERLDTTRRA